MCCYRSRFVFNCCLQDTDISQGSVATHLRCDRIFIDSTINKCSPDSDNETSLKIGQFDEVKTYNTKCAGFLGHPVEPTTGTTNCGSSRIDRIPNSFIYECHDMDVK